MPASRSHDSRPARQPNSTWSNRTTVTLDDELVAKAQGLTGIKERSSLMREALVALIARESAHRLALLGGSGPDLDAPPRRRLSME